MILSLIALSLGSAPQGLATFADNDKAIGTGVFDASTRAQVEENLDILVETAHRSRNDRELTRFSKDFQAAAEKNDEGYATSFSWISLSRNRFVGWEIICVNYGPVGRVAAFNKGVRVEIPRMLDLMPQRRPEVVGTYGKHTILACTFVRDAGVRENSSVWDLVVEAPKPLALPVATIEHTLDWGGASLQRAELTLGSIDTPKSFFVANTEPIFKRTRVFSLAGERLALISDEAGDKPLRFIDAWMQEARAAKKPDAFQKTLLRYLPEIQMIDDYEVKEYPDGSVAIRLIGSSGEVRFALKPARSSFRIASATGKVR